RERRQRSRRGMADRRSGRRPARPRRSRYAGARVGRRGAGARLRRGARTGRRGALRGEHARPGTLLPGGGRLRAAVALRGARQHGHRGDGERRAGRHVGGGRARGFLRRRPDGRRARAAIGRLAGARDRADARRPRAARAHRRRRIRRRARAVRGERAPRALRRPRRAAGGARAMIRNFLYSTISAGTAALLLLLYIAAARMLGSVDELGKFSFALLLGGVFETLMDFGLHQVTIRAVARDKSRASFLLRHALAIKLLWATAALAVLVVTANLLRPQWDVRLACYLIGGSLVFRSYMLTIRGVLQGLEHFGWDAIVVLADRILLLVVGVAALMMGTGLRGLAIAFVIARGAALVLALVVTQTRLGGVALAYDAGVWRELHRTALPLGFFLVVLNLYSYVDGVMLGSMRTDAETGLYAAAYRIYEGFTYAALALSTVLTPRLLALFTTDRGRHRALAIGGTSGSAALGAAVGVVAFVIAT